MVHTAHDVTRILTLTGLMYTRQNRMIGNSDLQLDLRFKEDEVRTNHVISSKHFKTDETNIDFDCSGYCALFIKDVLT